MFTVRTMNKVCYLVHHHLVFGVELFTFCESSRSLTSVWCGLDVCVDLCVIPFCAVTTLVIISVKGVVV